MSFIPQWLNDANTLVSLLGFGLTVYVTITLSSIKSSFLSRARLPDVIKDLDSASSALNGCLNQWPDQRNDAMIGIKTIISLLRATKSMVPKSNRSEIKRLVVTLEQISKPAANLSVDEIWAVYGDIKSVIVSITQASLNSKWE
ncbi:MAG: hypothetical protein V4735_02235 [Pseudomonadota bacterium]